MMPTGLRRYGLRVNPYGAPRLNRARSFQDRIRTARIHAFDNGGMKNYFRSIDRAPFLLVTGPDGSGRRVLADYCTALYWRWKTFPAGPKPFAHASYDPGENCSANQVITNALELLRQETDALGVTFREGPSAILGAATTNPSTVDYRIRYSGAMKQYAAAMKQAGSGFSVILENAESIEILDAAFQIFSNAPGVVVVRLGEHRVESIIKPFLNKVKGQVFEIRLQALTAAGVSSLAEHRWHKWKAIAPLPFDTTGLQRTFGKNPRTVGRTLDLLKEMIQARLTMSGPGPVWKPGTPDLEFDPQLIERLFEYLEKR